MVPVSYLERVVSPARACRVDHSPKQDAAKGNEHADDDRRGRRARDVGGLLQHETHGDGWTGGCSILERESSHVPPDQETASSIFFVPRRPRRSAARTDPKASGACEQVISYPCASIRLPAKLRRRFPCRGSLLPRMGYCRTRGFVELQGAITVTVDLDSPPCERYQRSILGRRVREGRYPA